MKEVMREVMKKDTIAELVDQAKESTDLEEIRIWSENVTHSLSKTHTRLANNFRHDLLGRLNPTNMALHRYNTVKTKVNDPNAIERAHKIRTYGIKNLYSLGTNHRTWSVCWRSNWNSTTI